MSGKKTVTLRLRLWGTGPDTYLEIVDPKCNGVTDVIVEIEIDESGVCSRLRPGYHPEPALVDESRVVSQAWEPAEATA